MKRALAVAVIFCFQAGFAGAEARLISRLIAQIEAQGEAEAWPSDLAELIGLKGDFDSKYLEHRSGKLSRACRLVYPPGSRAPTCLVVRTYLVDLAQHRSEAVFYRVELDGTLSRALRSTGGLDDEGEGVPSTLRETELDVKTPTVRKAVQKELDFWLKRNLRPMPSKAPAAAAAPSR